MGSKQLTEIIVTLYFLSIKYFGCEKILRYPGNSLLVDFWKSWM